MISAVGSDTWVTGSIPSKSSRLLLCPLEHASDCVSSLNIKS
jgi:hypothetical protein